MLGKKAIAPIIAFVLLMGLAVALGAFVTIWYTKASEKQTSELIGRLGTEEECSSVGFDVAFDYENCAAIIYNLGSFTIDKVKVDRYLSSDLTSAKTDTWNTGRGSAICAEGGLIPKNDCAIPMNASDKCPVPNSEPRRVLFSPIIVQGKEQTLCLNERIFEPNGSKFGCPGPVEECSE